MQAAHDAAMDKLRKEWHRTVAGRDEAIGDRDITINDETFYPVYKDYYILHGSGPANQNKWLCGDTTDHPMTDAIFSVGNVRVPPNILPEPRITYDVFQDCAHLKTDPIRFLCQASWPV